MLPRNNKKLGFVFDEIEKKKSSIYFVLETKKVSSFNEVKKILFSYLLKDVFDNMYQLDIKSLRNI